ncbi:MAG: 6-phosphogluconolactonase [Sciscionella sp.]
MSTPEVFVHATPDEVTTAAATRLVATLVDAQSTKGHASVVLTGGGTGIGVLTQLNSSTSRTAVDWQSVDIFWGDERFLPAGHPDRNETQAREALLDHVATDPSRVHAMEPSDGRFGDDPEAAAAAYAESLARLARPEDHGSVPTFDVLLLGMGPEGHIASMFPESPAVRETERSVVAVRNCPKPPPTRISLTRQAIQHAAQVWLVTTGTAKAGAVAMALGGAGEIAVPAVAARGRHRSLWLLDSDAAGQVPGMHTPPSS